MTLTLQIFHHQQWHDAATLSLPEPDKGRSGPAVLGYEQRYAVEWMERDDLCACALNYPVRLMEQFHGRHWFSFLDDIMPAGASRRYWVQRLGLDRLPPQAQDFELLRSGTIAPIGNLRIKEALPLAGHPNFVGTLRFDIRDVIERQSDFLEYAQQRGAASGGATGAGGEAPKLILRCSNEDQVWIDTWQDDPTCMDHHYLVKFPRNRRNAIDCDILRAEYHFYQELAALGMSTIETEAMRLEEGSDYPSLWLPRFDVVHKENCCHLLGLESLYSIMEKGPGEYLNMIEVIDTLVTRLARQYHVVEKGARFDREALVIELVRRDLLNVAFGNADNHGRNTAVLRSEHGVTLAPIYDFAPMKANPEGITRTTTWGAGLEAGGQFDWRGIAQALTHHVEAEKLMTSLQALGRQLLGLEKRLAARGVPTSILSHPAMGLSRLDERMTQWGLT